MLPTEAFLQVEDVHISGKKKGIRTLNFVICGSGVGLHRALVSIMIKSVQNCGRPDRLEEACLSVYKSITTTSEIFRAVLELVFVCKARLNFVV